MLAHFLLRMSGETRVDQSESIGVSSLWRYQSGCENKIGSLPVNQSVLDLVELHGN